MSYQHPLKSLVNIYCLHLFIPHSILCSASLRSIQFGIILLSVSFYRAVSHCSLCCSVGNRFEPYSSALAIIVTDRKLHKTKSTQPGLHSFISIFCLSSGPRLNVHSLFSLTVKCLRHSNMHRTK